MTSICHLCSQIADEPRQDLLRLHVGDARERRILREANGAVAMPSIGALTVGHLLVSPRVHRRSWASASAAELRDGLRLVAELAERLGERTGFPVHLFEHGNDPRSERVACSVEHAHWHVVPYGGTVDVEAATQRRWDRCSFDEATLRSSLATTEYLLYVAPDGTARACTGATPPSQMLRRVFAERLGIGDEWNWRDHPRPETVRATSDLLVGELLSA